MSNASRPRLVFISHAGEDTWVARQIAREIAARGAEVFLDEAHIEGGDEFDKILRDNLNRADELVVLFTPWAARPYVWSELGVAWGREIPIVVLLHELTVDAVQAVQGFPQYLKTRHMLSLNEVDKYLDQLANRVTTDQPDE